MCARVQSVEKSIYVCRIILLILLILITSCKYKGLIPAERRDLFEDAHSVQPAGKEQGTDRAEEAVYAIIVGPDQTNNEHLFIGIHCDHPILDNTRAGGVCEIAGKPVNLGGIIKSSTGECIIAAGITKDKCSEGWREIVILVQAKNAFTLHVDKLSVDKILHDENNYPSGATFPSGTHCFKIILKRTDVDAISPQKMP